jgi:hypothetical protein
MADGPGKAPGGQGPGPGGQHAGQIGLVERSFCGQDADRHGGPGRGEGQGRGPVGCGSSRTGCGRHVGPRPPCPPHGAHASIGARPYRARSFFASAPPAPLPRSFFDQHEPSVWAHPPPGKIRLRDLEPEPPQALGSAHSIRSAIPIGRGCRAIRARPGRRGPRRNWW